MVTTLNQVRHLYVANAYKEADAVLSSKGDITVKAIGDSIDKEIYFEVLGPNTVLKSDRIPVKGIKSIKAIKSSAMNIKMKKVLVSLDTSLLDADNNLAYTEDYVLRINLRQFYGMSDEDQYFKDAVIRAVAGTTPTAFYTAMTNALNLSFSREVGATTTSNPYLSFTASSTGIIIEEKEQPWSLGVQAVERVYFDVVPTTIYNAAIGDVVWGTVTPQSSSTTIGNGKRIADLEYFLLGERGDQYRKIGWPNDIETEGLVSASKSYNVLEIHYTFADTGVNNYNTEKDITIVSPKGSSGHEYDVINAVIGAINTAVGSTIVATLS